MDPEVEPEFGTPMGGFVYYPFSAFWLHLVDFGAIIELLDFQGGPKIDHFWKKQK